MIRSSIKTGIAMGLFIGALTFTAEASYDLGRFLNKKIREKLYSGDSKDKSESKVADSNDNEDEIHNCFEDDDIFEEEDK